MNSIKATVNHDNLISTIKLSIKVHNLDELNNVIANVRKVESVINVIRASH